MTFRVKTILRWSFELWRLIPKECVIYKGEFIPNTWARLLCKTLFFSLLLGVRDSHDGLKWNWNVPGPGVLIYSHIRYKWFRYPGYVSVAQNVSRTAINSLRSCQKENVDCLFTNVRTRRASLDSAIAAQSLIAIMLLYYTHNGH